MRSAASAAPTLGTVGVVLINGLGDCLLAVPVVRALQALSRRLITIVPPGVGYDAVLLELCPTAVHIDAIFMPGQSRWEIDIGEAFNTLLSCAHVVFMVDWDSIQLEKLRVRLNEAGIRTYVHAFNRGFKHPSGRDLHQVERNLQLAQAVIGARASTIRLANEHTARSTSPIISVHPETTVLQKTYPIDQWATLIDEIGGAFAGAQVFVHGLDYAEQIVAQCTRAVVPMLGTVRDALEVAAESLVLVAVDSYLLHFTDLIGVPAVALFRSTDPSRWGPYFTSNSKVYQLQDLRDCATRRALIEDMGELMRSRLSG